MSFKTRSADHKDESDDLKTIPWECATTVIIQNSDRCPGVLSGSGDGEKFWAWANPQSELQPILIAFIAKNDLLLRTQLSRPVHRSGCFQWRPGRLGRVC
jgi:hypothetical protein